MAFEVLVAFEGATAPQHFPHRASARRPARRSHTLHWQTQPSAPTKHAALPRVRDVHALTLGAPPPSQRSDARRHADRGRWPGSVGVGVAGRAGTSDRGGPSSRWTGTTTPAESLVGEIERASGASAGSASTARLTLDFGRSGGRRRREEPGTGARAGREASGARAELATGGVTLPSAPSRAPLPRPPDGARLPLARHGRGLRSGSQSRGGGTSPGRVDRGVTGIASPGLTPSRSPLVSTGAPGLPLTSSTMAATDAAEWRDRSWTAARASASVVGRWICVVGLTPARIARGNDAGERSRCRVPASQLEGLQQRGDQCLRGAERYALGPTVAVEGHSGCHRGEHDGDHEIQVREVYFHRLTCTIVTIAKEAVIRN